MEKRLYRIKNRQAMLGGVSQGLSEYFNIDVTLIRVVFVLLFFTPVPAFFAYFILWVVLPVKYDYGFAGVGDSQAFNSTNDIYSQTGGEPHSNFTFMSSHNQKNNLVGGAVLIVLGILFLADNFFPYFEVWHYFWKMWPIGLVVLGIWLIIKDKKDDNFTNFTNNDSSPNL